MAILSKPGRQSKWHRPVPLGASEKPLHLAGGAPRDPHKKSGKSGYHNRLNQERTEAGTNLPSAWRSLVAVYITWERLEQNKTGQVAVYGYVFDRSDAARVGREGEQSSQGYTSIDCSFVRDSAGCSGCSDKASANRFWFP